MRIRTIKPEFWTDPFIVSIPHLARLVYISLFGVADDFGYIEDEPERIAMLVMPMEDPVDVFECLDLFVASNRLEVLVNDDGSKYLRLINFEKHQRVDRPTKSKIHREDSRKITIPFATRRGVAEKYKCEPGESTTCNCYYCGSEGRIHWHRLRSGKPSSWISFAGLELDHHQPESGGGSTDVENIVLACRNCNRSKASKDWLPFMSSRNKTMVVETIREDSRGLDLEGKGIGKEKEGKEQKEIETLHFDLPFESFEFRIAWNDWLQHRIEKKKKMTKSTATMQLKEMKEIGESRAINMIKYSIKNGWTGLFEDKTSFVTPIVRKPQTSDQFSI
jgi:5-methylcytosine-specific restriction endonuclease McrA